MTFSIQEYTGDGTTTDFAITFDYLDATHVRVAVNGVPTTNGGSLYSFSFVNSTTVRIVKISDGTSAPDVGAAIKISRQTPITDPPVVWPEGASLTTRDLNKLADYLTYSLQESLDANEGATLATAAAEAAEASATAAAASQAASASSASSAASSASAAAGSASAASTSASAAASSASASSTSATASAASAAAAATSELNAANAAADAAVATASLFQENRIINGAFDFWQRGTSQTSNGFDSADRWQNIILGGTVTMSRQSFNLGDTLGNNSPTFFLRQSVSGQTLASHYAYIAQRIEDVRSYAGQTITLLGWARRSSGSGNMGVNLTQGFGTGGASPSGFVNTAGQIVTLSSTWQPFAVTFAIPSITGKTLGTDGNSFLQTNFWTSAGSDLNAGSGSLGLQTIGVDLWGIHIKVGTHTTAAVDLYNQPELGPELARCQRYYQSQFTGSLENPSAGALRLGGNFIVEMRGIPSMSVTTGAVPTAENTKAWTVVLPSLSVMGRPTADAEL